MAKVYDSIDAALTEFLHQQHVFFVATAPLAPDGHLNLSPKGLNTFAVLAPGEVAYLDLTGSGVETIAHLGENGRIVMMFCAFEGLPRIVRLYGRGAVLAPSHPDFSLLRARFPELPGVRSIIRVQVERVADSCGYGVPLYRYQGERSQLPEWAARKGENGVAAYRAANNAASIDGLPGLPRG